MNCKWGFSMNRSDVEDIKTFSALFIGEQTDQGTQDIKSCLGMIIKIAKAYSGLGVAMADLLQSGAIGVLEARAAFIPGTIGRTGNVVKFSTYARYHILDKISACAGANKKSQHDLLLNYTYDGVAFPAKLFAVTP